jgi:biotin carboxylase
MTPSRGAILIGFANALAAPEAAASLIGAGYQVLAFTRRGQPVSLARARAVELVPVAAPEEDLSQCLADVAAAATRADATMPLDDASVFVCDAALDSHAVLAGPRGDRARLALDKRLQLRAAETAGIPVPDWQELSADQLTPSSTAIPMPAIAKPALAVDTRDGRIRRLSPRAVANESELSELRRRWGAETPVLLQRIVHGVGAGVFGLADHNGVHHLSAHRRLRMMNPAGSGSSACVSAPVPPDLATAIQRFIEETEWEGLFMVELLHAADQTWFMELNGRPWGSLALARRLGYEYPAWAVDRALGGTEALPQEPALRTLVCRNLGREVVHLLFVMRGPRGYVSNWPRRSATLRALLGGGGETAWYNRTPELRGVFLYDAWRTVAAQTWGKGRE